MAPPPAVGARSAARVKADYSRVQQLLAKGKDEKPWKEDDPQLGILIEKAWALMGEWAVAYLRTHAHASSKNLIAGLMSELNAGWQQPLHCPDQEPEEPADEAALRALPLFCYLDSYRIDAGAIRLGTGGVPAYAIAVSYGYRGRLLVVSREGMHASAEIDRGGKFFPLPGTSTGHDRFYIDANPNDWPTSSCGGGQVSIWEWDGKRAVALVNRTYGYPRDDRHAWGVHRRGRWIKVYTRDELETFGDLCPDSDLKAVRKIRIGPRRVEELGIEYVVPEFEVVNKLLYRTMRGERIADIATPGLDRDLAEVLSKREPLPGYPYFVGVLGRWRRTPDLGAVRFAVTLSDVEFVFRVTEREGRPYVADMLAPTPKAAAYLQAVRAKVKQLGGDRWSPKTWKTASRQVAMEQPDLVPGREEVRRVRYCRALSACELMPREQPGMANTRN